MLKGYVDAYMAFNEEAFLTMALKNAHFLLNKQLKEDGGLYRNYKNGKSSINAYLEDYATLIDAFLSLYQVTLDENWLHTSKQLTDYCFDHFYDDKTKMFFFTSNSSRDLILRKIETEDNVIPFSNAIMANNLFLLGHYFYNDRYKMTAITMLNNVKDEALSYGGSSAKWLSLYANYLGEFYEIAVSGSQARQVVKEINKPYIPNKLVVGSIKESQLPLLQLKYSPGKTIIYTCIDGACKLPVESSGEALKQIDTKLKKP
ncbi:MAG: hypothetical protein U5K51_05385 [Flavobacteriaceae bacterium]|nr:hypothetical protein [Flavobacteriaceae bacterium]